MNVMVEKKIQLGNITELFLIYKQLWEEQGAFYFWQ